MEGADGDRGFVASNAEAKIRNVRGTDQSKAMPYRVFDGYGAAFDLEDPLQYLKFLGVTEVRRWDVFNNLFIDKKAYFVLLRLSQCLLVYFWKKFKFLQSSDNG